MSRNATGSTVRYSPDRGHRSSRRPPLRAAASALAIAGPVGVMGVVGIGIGRALPIAAVTAALTVLGVLVWRWTLPHLVSVTVTDAEITYRSYGRTRRVQRNENVRGAARLLQTNHGFESPLLIIAGDGGQFMLNTDVWREEDLLGIAGTDVTWTTEPTTTNAKELEHEFPGLLPVHVTHPNRFAIVVVIVAVAAVIGVQAAFSALTADGGEGDAEAPATGAPLRAADLTAEDIGTQNRLQADVQRLLGADADWSSVGTTTRDCTTSSGWQRIITWTNDNPRPTYSQDDVSNVTAKAEAADLAVGEASLVQGKLERLAFGNPRTEAELEVTSEDGSLKVSTASACAIPG